MLKPFLTILLLPIVFLGCTLKEDIQSIELNQEFITRVGQYHMTPDKDYIFGISKIVEDSRGSCPRTKNVSCVWDGAITIQLKATNLSGDGQTNYQEVMAHQRQYFGDYLLEIHKVFPSKPKRNHERYRFTFELSHLSHDELMALENQKQERHQEIQNTLQASSKVQIAAIRERYGNFDPKILSKADADEIISLEETQAKLALEYQAKVTDWNIMDPATRGSQPEMSQDLQMERNNPRLQELQAKVRIAYGVKREIERMKKLSKTHNIAILDNEMSELIELHTAQQMIQGEMSKAIMKALTSADGQINAEALVGLADGGQLNGAVIEKLPRDLLQRMSEISQRIEVIQAPFETAEKADDIREQMTKLSETSGVATSSSEIEETIALNAEKDRILKRTQIDAGKKWMAEGSPVSAVQKPVPNAQDGARLKEIEARLKVIAPLWLKQSKN